MAESREGLGGGIGVRNTEPRSGCDCGVKRRRRARRLPHKSAPPKYKGEAGVAVSIPVMRGR